MKKGVKITIIVVVVLAIVGGIIWKLSSNYKKINEKKNEESSKADFVIPVNVLTVESKPLSNNLVKTATLVPFEEADIMVAAPGQITSLKFDLGTKVSEGQVIGKTDSRLKELNLQSSELALAKLETDYKRYKELYEGGGVTEVNFKDIEFNYNNTKVQVEQARKQVADAQIKAPVSGTVVAKNVEVGEYANPGNPLGTVVNISKLKINVKVAETDVYSLTEGMTVNVTSSQFPGQNWKGTVRFVSPRGDAAHNYTVEVVIDNPKNTLKAGTFVYVDFSRETNETAIQIPRSALPESVKNPYVYLNVNNKAIRRVVTPGRELGDYVEILDGLKPGDQVIINGQINLRDSTAIQPIMEGAKK